MKRPDWLNRQVFGWSMFDFANQAFTLVILTTMFQIYFISHVVPGVAEAPAADASVAVLEQYAAAKSEGRQLWSTSNIIAQIIVLLISPIVGALADFSGAKKRLLLVTYIACVALTGALGLAGPGMVALAMILFIVGYVFYATGENFMAAFLPELAAPRDMGKVSAFGFTLGYSGGLFCFAGAVAISLIWPGATGYRLICVWAALFFLASALPTFLLLRETKNCEPMPAHQNIITVGFTRVWATFHSLRQYRQLFRFLVIMMIYMSGMKIVIFFGGTIAKAIFELTDVQLGLYIVVSVVSAIVGAFATGRYQDRLGTRNTILLGLVIWTIIMIAIVFVRPEWKEEFWGLWVVIGIGAAVGFGMGMLGTASRSLVALFAPQHKSAEFFGFYGLAHMASAIICLSSNIVAERVWGEENYNLVVGSGVLFFVVGIVLMLTINERDGRVVALKATRQYRREMKQKQSGDSIDNEP